MIVVVDYGMGNLRSVSKALEEVGAKVKVSDDPKVVSGADKLVVPGVGAFKDAMRELRARRLIEPIKKFVKSDRPFLGLCLGLQLLFSESEEGGRSKGLDIIKGRVLRFSRRPLTLGEGEDALKIPHMGWNRLIADGKCPLLKGIPDGSYMYFVHSYYADPDDDGCVAAWTDYGIEFPSVVWFKNIYATQFHPEKSQ
ncbi:MAG: imidazole glycerol phosphate synthase subunit HisH, partial [Candidatus Omnitrophota bacterium]|nr:imidazole glycerol phosphate synthase subunit HisH [Candidatus Omnitrophota bacterium]